MSVTVSNSVLENYEDLLVAVKETPRGRAFLEEFSKRHRREDTQTILNAIHKIEAVVSEVVSSQNLDPNFAAARQSISTIRQQIAGLADETLSNAVPLSERIASALKLVDDLDQRMQTKPHHQAAVGAPQSFASDTDIFVDPAPKPNSRMVTFERPQASPAINPVTSAAATAEKEVKQGARLTISRIIPKVAELLVSEVEFTSPQETENSEKPEVSAITEATFPAAALEDQSKRIVVIRRPANEAIEIPFLDDIKNENAA